MEWDGGSRVQTYLSILCFDAQFSRKGSAGFRFAASQVETETLPKRWTKPIGEVYVEILEFWTIRSFELEAPRLNKLIG